MQDTTSPTSVKFPDPTLKAYQSPPNDIQPSTPLVESPSSLPPRPGSMPPQPTGFPPQPTGMSQPTVSNVEPTSGVPQPPSAGDQPPTKKKTSQGLMWGVIILVILVLGGGAGLFLSKQGADIRQEAHVDGNRGVDCGVEVSEGFKEDGTYWYKIAPKAGQTPLVHSNAFICSGQQNDDGTVHCDDSSEYQSVKRLVEIPRRPVDARRGVLEQVEEGSLNVPCGGEVQIDFWLAELLESEECSAEGGSLLENCFSYDVCSQWLHSFAPVCSEAPTPTVPVITPTPTVPVITPTPTVPVATPTPSLTSVPSPTPTGPTSTPVPPTATPTPNQQLSINCDDECASNADCANTSHICFTINDGSNRCRLESNPSDRNCQPVQVAQTRPAQVVQNQPALPAELPQTGPTEWLNWLEAGLAAVGVGAALLLLL